MALRSGKRHIPCFCQSFVIVHINSAAPGAGHALGRSMAPARQLPVCLASDVPYEDHQQQCTMYILRFSEYRPNPMPIMRFPSSPPSSSVLDIIPIQGGRHGASSVDHQVAAGRPPTLQRWQHPIFKRCSEMEHLRTSPRLYTPYFLALTAHYLPKCLRFSHL